MAEGRSGRAGLALAAVAALALVAAWVLRAPAVPAVRLVTVDGRSVDLRALAGRVVVVDFWATTCNACRAEMPRLVRAWQDYHARGLELVAVAMSYDRPDWVLAYARGAQLPFDVALDPDGSVARAFGGVQLTPTLWLVGRDGRLRQRFLGSLAARGLDAAVERELARPARAGWL